MYKILFLQTTDTKKALVVFRVGCIPSINSCSRAQCFVVEYYLGDTPNSLIRNDGFLTLYTVQNINKNTILTPVP